jgi:ABC-type polysaccharide/polyol phosphate export permease
MSTLSHLYRHRALLAVLTSRELKARYRGSALGFLWSLLNPLLMLGVYAVVFQVLMPSRAAATSPYALFLFCGLLPWTWLASSLTDAADSLLASGPLLRKVLRGRSSRCRSSSSSRGSSSSARPSSSRR